MNFAGIESLSQRTDAEPAAVGKYLLLLSFNLSHLHHVIEVRRQNKLKRFLVDGPDIVRDLARHRLLESVFLNDAVTFPNPDNLARLLRELACVHKLPVTVASHDFLAVCPSHTLLNRDGRYCNVPNLEICRKCLPANQFGFCTLFVSGTIDDWRKTRGDYLAAASKILCFSHSSKEIIRKAYPELPEAKFEIRPHTIHQPPLRVPNISRCGPVHIGVVGNIQFHKGANIIKELAEEIVRRRSSIKISIIGTIDSKCSSTVVSVTGAYEWTKLPDLIEKSGANVFLLPSIWPETFSYVTQELISMQVPLVCFDLGAPAERVAGYPLGRVIRLDNAAAILDQLIEIRTALGATA